MSRAPLLALTSLIAVTSPLIGGVVDTSFGPATAYRDSATQLLWLDLTLTANHSYNSVMGNLAPGGIYYGWRFATPAELVRFFDDYTPRLSHIVALALCGIALRLRKQRVHG